VMVVISAGLMLYLGTLASENGEIDWQDWRLFLVYGALCLSNSLASLFSLASTIAVERDWVVTLSNKEPELLAGMYS
jgi:hypothetical protein